MAKKSVPSVDAFLASLQHPMKGGIQELRVAILASNPSLTERIKWNAPSFCHRGDDRVTFRLPPKGGVQLVLHRGVKGRDSKTFTFDDRSGLIQWAAPDRGVVTLTGLREVAARKKAIVALVSAWILATDDGSAR